MGATTFITVSSGKNANEAFQTARSNALHEDGHGGYTGTIAEKHSFKMATDKTMNRAEAARLANDELENENSRFDDKFGPAGCISLEGGGYMFFGWASD